jgi:hypothetical protein
MISLNNVVWVPLPLDCPASPGPAGAGLIYKFAKIRVENFDIKDFIKSLLDTDSRGNGANCSTHTVFVM